MKNKDREVDCNGHAFISTFLLMQDYGKRAKPFSMDMIENIAHAFLKHAIRWVMNSCSIEALNVN